MTAAAGVSRLYSSQPVSEEVSTALEELAGALAEAIQKAKRTGVPQGLVVAILAGHFHQETGNMLADCQAQAGT